MDDVKKLAKEFARLIQERDSIPFHKHENNPRCAEIDDVLIPQIIKQVPSGSMKEFNVLINSIHCRVVFRRNWRIKPCC